MFMTPCIAAKGCGTLLFHSFKRRTSSSSCFTRRVLLVRGGGGKSIVDKTSVAQQWFSTAATRDTTNHDSAAAIKDKNKSNINFDTAPLSDLVSFPAYTLADPLPSHHPIPTGQRIVMVGDVHGDLEALENLLAVAQVYNPDTGAWIGGDTICVQCGDIMDRGGQELACWQLLCRLSHEAAAAGGNVTVLWGNHEVLNALGMFHYATPGAATDEFEYYLGQPLDLHSPMRTAWRRQFANHEAPRWAACEPGGLLAQSLWGHLQVALVVGKTLCVHAGLTTRHLQAHEDSIALMNAAAREWITTAHHGPNFNTIHPKVKADDMIQLANARAQAASKTLPACLGGHGTEEESPVWMRDYSLPVPTKRAENLLNNVLALVGAERIVMGHTPQEEGINAALQGKAWRIDVGASRGIGGGTPQVLEIVHGGDDERDQISILTPSGRVAA